MLVDAVLQRLRIVVCEGLQGHALAFHEVLNVVEVVGFAQFVCSAVAGFAAVAAVSAAFEQRLLELGA